MKVITLDTATFVDACHALEDMAATFAPDIVVGIAHGGVEVARNMFDKLPHVTVDAHRPSTSVKNSHPRLMACIKRLPRWAKNTLRILENRILTSKKPGVPVVSFNPSALAGFRRILVVDDAVDSGSTARTVLDVLGSLPGSPSTALAVITVTTRNPITNADFALYRNGTLIRFPWSMDN